MPCFAKPSKVFLALECACLFVALPVLIFLHTTRWNVPLALWGVTAYAVVILNKTTDFSWRRAWAGSSLKPYDFWVITSRFVISSIGVVFLAEWIEPDFLFNLPHQKPLFWLLIMALYPLLSALPQEIVFRTFFMRRYAPLFSRNGEMLAAAGFAFGFIHIVFHNPISPLLSFICGFFLSSSYAVHQSLKRATIEHGFYGDMVFTVGLGYYFIVGHYS